MSAKPPLTLASVVVRTDSSNFIYAEVHNEAVAFDVPNDIYYGLNPVGSRIWRLIETPISVEDICAALVSEYDVAPEICERQVIELLDELRSEGLVTMHENAGTAADEPPRK